MWKIDEIFNVLGKERRSTKEILITGVSIDSRTIKRGEIFIALEGVNYDGHKFIEQALEKGASLVIANKTKRKDNFPIICVNDTKTTLINLARFARNRINNLLVIAVTGSCGKTTLKEWLFKILKDDYNSHCNFGNFNNEIGMPLTLLNMPKNTQICILEIGMNNRGEIQKLAEIAKPNIKIITNIGFAHIGNLKSKKNIALEKSDIFTFHSKNGISIIPRDDKFYEYLLKKASKFKNEKVLSFGRNIKSTFRIIDDPKQKKDVKIVLYKKRITLKKHLNLSGWEENISIILGLIETLEIKAEMPLMEDELKSVNGFSYSLKTLTEKNGIIVLFTCNTCPFVVKWEDRYKITEELAKKNNLGFVYVNSNYKKRDGDDSFEEMKKHAKKEGYSMPYLLDKNARLANLLKAKTTPHIYFFDGASRLIYTGSIDNIWDGKRKKDVSYLKNAINNHVNQKKIKPSETPAKGCSIKRIKNKTTN